MMTKHYSKQGSLYRAIVVGAMSFFAGAAGQAEERWLPKSLQIHGFLSQSVIRTTHNNFFGPSKDRYSLDFRELGVNASWQPHPSFQAALQLVIRDAGQTDNGDIRVDYGLADYALISTEHNLLGIRGGRVPTPLGLYNDTRDVAATRPGILLPQSIYFDVNRNVALSGDGGYLYGEHRTDYGDFLLETGVITPRTDDPDFKEFVVDGFPGEMEGEISWIGRLTYEWGGGALRLAATYADFNADFNPANIPLNLQHGSFKFNPLVLSFQYNAERWSLTSEYAWRKVRLKDFGPPPFKSTGESYYVQGIYRLRHNVEAMVRYDQLIWDRGDRDGKEFEAAGLGPSHSRFAKDWTFGLRWYITPSLLLSGEYHRVNGTGWLSRLENKEGATQNWNLYAVMFSYSF